ESWTTTASFCLHFRIRVGQMPAHPRLLSRLSNALPPLLDAARPAGIRRRDVGTEIVEKVLCQRVSISEMTFPGRMGFSPFHHRDISIITYIHRSQQKKK